MSMKRKGERGFIIDFGCNSEPPELEAEFLTLSAYGTLGRVYRPLAQISSYWDWNC